MTQTKLWTLVLVERGFPSSLMFYKCEEEAHLDQTRLNAVINPDYDETELFEVNLEDLIQNDRVKVNV